MAKRLFSAVLALMLIFSLLPAAVFAEGEDNTEYSYEAPKLRVLEADEKIGGRNFKKGMVVMYDIPPGIPFYFVTITDESGKEYHSNRHGFGGNTNVTAREIDFGWFEEDAMKAGTYSVSVFYENDQRQQINDASTKTYSYTYPDEKYGNITDIAWTEDGNFQWTPPSGLPDNDVLVVEFKCKLEGQNWYNNMYEAEMVRSFNEQFLTDRFNSFINQNGEGDYSFRMRVISTDIIKCYHGDWSEWSEARHIVSAGDLEKSIKGIAASDTAAAVAAVRALDISSLTTSMTADNEGTGVVSALADLETKLGLTAEVKIEAESGLDVDSPITVVGAGFNTTNNTKPTLTISKPETLPELPADDAFLNANAIRVELDFSLGNAVEENEDGSLLVPIRITMPVPESIKNPRSMRILHYKANGTYDREIWPHIYQDENNVWMASFVVTHLSPFVFIEAAQGGSETPPAGGTFTVTFNANGGTVSPATAVTGANGKLASLPAPTRSGHTFAGWFTAADGGERVTTATVFSQNTTVYAHWTAGSSGGGSGSGGSSSGGSGSSGGSTPAKPTTPTEPEKPTTPSVPVIDASERFSDVAKDAWYTQDVSYAVYHGLMNGTGSGFEPNAPLSRAMLAQVLYNYQGNPAVSAAAGFTDVSGGWYADAVAWAASKGIVLGNSDGSFNPNGAISREQFAVMLYRFAQGLGIDVSARGDLSVFTDSGKVSNYAAEAMAWAAASGLINGSNGRLDPAGSATRAQAAAILHRFCENVIK